MVPHMYPQEELVGGSLVGPNPEALCREAPKGQPVIRRENIKAVCVEAPEGQPSMVFQSLNILSFCLHRVVVA